MATTARFSVLVDSEARSGGHLRLSRFVPQVNVRFKILHHFLELREVERLRAIADRFLRRGMRFYNQSIGADGHTRAACRSLPLFAKTVGPTDESEEITHALPQHL